MAIDKQAAARLGRSGEDAALQYLQRQGLALVRRNFRCRLGELDLIMRDGDALVFVEVRSRADRGHRYGTPAESIGAAKRRRLARAAQVYLQTLTTTPPCRFDVVTVSGAAGDGAAGDGAARRLEWIKDAFYI